MTSARIRPAQPSDTLQIVHMADRFQSVAGYPLRGDPAYFSIQVQNIIGADDAECFVVDLDQKGIVGFLIAEIHTSRLTPALLATEVMMWVEPKYRGKSFFRLLREYEAWAKSKGASAAFLSAVMDGRTSKVYERIGYEAVQTHHVKVF